MSLIERLLLVQQHDCVIRGLERELRDIPQRKTEIMTKAASHRQAVIDAETQLKKLQADLKQGEGEIGARQEKILKLRQQQMTLKTNQEFKAIETEVKAVETDIRAVEDRQLDIMEKIETTTTSIQEAKGALEKEEQALKAIVQTLDVRAGEVNGKLAAEKSARDKAAEGIDSRAMMEYQGIMSRREQAIVSIEEGNCGGCHLKLPPFVVHDAHRNQSLVKCNFCGRILY